MMGEGMVCLWAGLKSVLRPGDKVLAVRYSRILINYALI